MELESLYLAVALVTLAAPVFRAPWRISLGTGALIGVTLFVSGLPDWYNPDAAMSSFSLVSSTFPPKMTVPHVGYPGVKDYPCQVSGLHSRNFAPGTPNDLNSETGTTIQVETIASAGWLPRKLETLATAYQWTDWAVFSHKTMLWPFSYSPVYETAKCGLGKSASLWEGFTNGGTYCKSSEDFYLLPSKKKACLGDFIATLSCNETNGFCSTKNQIVEINGNPSEAGEKFYLSPFDSDIRGGTENTACSNLFNEFYYDSSSLSISFPGTGITISRSGKNLVSLLLCKLCFNPTQNCRKIGPGNSSRIQSPRFSRIMQSLLSRCPKRCPRHWTFAYGRFIRLSPKRKRRASVQIAKSHHFKRLAFSLGHKPVPVLPGPLARRYKQVRRKRVDRRARNTRPFCRCRWNLPPKSHK